jgi:hypothetical protein
MIERGVILDQEPRAPEIMVHPEAFQLLDGP